MTNSATKIEMAQNIAQNIAQNMAEKTNSLDRSLTLAAVKNIANTKFDYDFMIPKEPQIKIIAHHTSEYEHCVHPFIHAKPLNAGKVRILRVESLGIPITSPFLE